MQEYNSLQAAGSTCRLRRALGDTRSGAQASLPAPNEPQPQPFSLASSCPWMPCLGKLRYVMRPPQRMPSQKHPPRFASRSAPSPTRMNRLAGPFCHSLYTGQAPPLLATVACGRCSRAVSGLLPNLSLWQLLADMFLDRQITISRLEAPEKSRWYHWQSEAFS